MNSLLLVALLGCLATVFAAPHERVRWCVTSQKEQQKCTDLSKKAPVFSCVRKDSILNCITAIKAREADAMTLDGGDIYMAGLNNYNLQPIAAENYGTNSETCYYAVAVVKKDSGFNFTELQGKRSCHTGLGKSAGWNIPIGTLVSMDLMQWEGIEDKPLEEVVSEYFEASCAPGADRLSKLCKLCKGDCSKTHNEPFYGYDGAFQCLAEGAGDVAFVKHLTVPEAEKSKYELLCKDNRRDSIDNYQRCHLAKVPAHAVVTRKDAQLAEFIWQNLNETQFSQVFNLFSSEAYAPSKNLMFKDSTQKLVKVPSNTDSFLYLGAEYTSIIHSIKKESPSTSTHAIRWCAVGQAETAKCDSWTSASVSPSINPLMNEPATIECSSAPTVDDCLKKIMRKEADAMAVDGGQVYTAGKCGLVPVMVEQYDEGSCGTSGAVASSYFAVAVIKKDSVERWDDLKDKRSCHTGIGRTAGWNIPMGHIRNMTNDCDFSKFFKSGCAPGSNPDSPFCEQCAGNGKAVGENFKCKASAEEKYYGYAGAFRCLVEGSGDVAFIKHTTISDTINGTVPEWAKYVNSDDYQLICPGKTPVQISEYKSCNLAEVPAHAVVTRPDISKDVVRILQEQQKHPVTDDDFAFRMFKSENGKNLLFKDSTKCLQEIQAGTTYDKFLGEGYMYAMTSLKECGTSDLETSCSFHSCQQKN